MTDIICDSIRNPNETQGISPLEIAPGLFPAQHAGDSAGAATDQFYTRPDLARTYAGAVAGRWPEPDVLFVEPSAGDGAFVRPLQAAGRSVRAMDIAPMGEDIALGDFLGPHNLFRSRHARGNFADSARPSTIVVGNPPFGKNSSLAVKFFNRAARDADAIAFIVPRTFRKMSLQRRLDPHFHLVADEDVPPDAFLLHGRPHDVPCAWQIWERRSARRELPDPPCVDHLIEYTKPALADFAMRRVGFYAGRVLVGNLFALSETTHYFLREVTKGVISMLESIDWLDVSAQTAGVRSLSKQEIAFKLGGLEHGY